MGQSPIGTLGVVCLGCGSAREGVKSHRCCILMHGEVAEHVGGVGGLTTQAPKARPMIVGLLTLLVGGFDFLRAYCTNVSNVLNSNCIHSCIQVNVTQSLTHALTFAELVTLTAVPPAQLYSCCYFYRLKTYY